MSLQFLDEGNYYKIYDEKGNTCLIDKEDRIKIEKYDWRHGRGYWIAVNPENTSPYLLTMHRIIMDAQENEVIDHIKQVQNGFTDNRKQNLRKCNFQENCFNRVKQKNNTSGIIGVRKRKTKYGEYWRAQIKINGKMKTLGEYKDKEKAIKKRLQAEKEYFGEFAPQRELFEKYGI